MAQDINKKAKRGAWHLSIVQISVVLLSALIAAHWGRQAALSLVIGGLVNILPNVVFARYVFAKAGAQAARQIMANVYWGEAVKIVLTAVMMVVVLKWVTITPLAFFMGFIVAQCLFWSAGFWFRRAEQD